MTEQHAESVTPAKLLPGEKCHVCRDKPAKGIKYNAISCDSCRVFFRRIVLIKDSHPNRNTWSKCTYGALRQRSPHADEIALRQRCQHCRLKLCYQHGMADHYVTNSIAGKKRKQAIREAQDRFEQRKKKQRTRTALAQVGSVIATSPTTSSNQEVVLRPYTVYDKSSYLIMPSARNYFTGGQSEKTVSLNDFWSFYINPQSPANVLKLKQIRDAPSATVTSTEKIFQGWMRKKALMSSWELKKPAQANRMDALRSTKMYEHIRDSLLLHFHSVLVMFTFTPELDKLIPHETRSNMAIASYGELIVIRWAHTAHINEQGELKINALSGSKISGSNLKELGLLKGFLEYFEVTKKILATGADSTDLALLSALSVLTCDRGVPLTRKEAKAVYKFQEAIGEILHKKCKQEGKPKKFTALIEVLALLRSTVKQVDLDKMRNYQAKIMSNPASSKMPTTRIKDVTDLPVRNEQTRPVRSISRASTIDVETLSDISDPSQQSHPTSSHSTTSSKSSKLFTASASGYEPIESPPPRITTQPHQRHVYPHYLPIVQPYIAEAPSFPPQHRQQHHPHHQYHQQQQQQHRHPTVLVPPGGSHQNKVIAHPYQRHPYYSSHIRFYHQPRSPPENDPSRMDSNG